MTQTLRSGEAIARLDMATLCELRQMLTVMSDRVFMAQERLRILHADGAAVAEVRHDLRLVQEHAWRLHEALTALYTPELAQ